MLFWAPVVFLLLIVWGIVSWWNIVNPDEVALRQYFGWLEKKILTSGLHFVPWFPGIKLVRVPKKMFRLLYEKDGNKPGSVMSGNMMGVRSKDRQKLFIELTVFVRFPYRFVNSLVRIIESGVPLEEGALRDWIEDAVAPDVLYTFGQRKYEDVMGGRANEALNTDINERLQKRGSLLRSCGLFGNGPEKNDPGTGEAFLKIEDVHLSGPLGESLERVVTAKLEAEASESEAKTKARLIGAPIEIMFEQWIKGEAKRMGVTVPEATKALKDSGAYARKEKELNELRQREMAGGGSYDVEEKNINLNINSGGEPLKDSDMAAFIGTIGGAVAAYGAAKGGGSSGGGQSGNRREGKKKPGGKNTGGEKKDEMDDYNWS